MKTRLLAVLLAFTFCGTGFAADNWPSQAVEFVAPAAPGGDTDRNLRLYLRYMERELGQPMITVNMAGANGVVGITNVAQAKPNGYRALFFHSGALISTIMGFTELSLWDDFELAAVPVIDKSNCFLANSKAPYNNAKELVEYAKANPGKLNYGSGLGSFTHLLILAFEDVAGVSINTPDSGDAAEKVTALLGGRIDLISTQYGLVLDYIKNGDMKCVGILSDKRLENASDVPTFAEFGYNVSFDKFFFVAFPKGTPREIIDKFNAASKKVSEDPEYQKECIAFLTNATHYSPEGSVEYLKGQDALYRKYEKTLLGEE